MAGGAKLVAVAPLVVVKDVAGVDHYVYAGQPLTAVIPVERLKQLVAEGKLAEVSQKPRSDDVEVPTERPAKNATVAVWRAYAARVGVDTEGLKKDELIEAVEAAEDDSDGDGADTESGDDGDGGVDDPDAPTIS